MVVSVVPGERTAENVVAVVEDVKRRTAGRLMDLITTDGYPAYEEAILDAYGETITPPRTGQRGRPKAPYTVAPKGLTYAVVEKTREGPSGVDRHAGGLRHDGGRGGGVGDIARQHGNQYVVRGASERDGPAPQRPEGRKTYRFSKDWRFHEAVTYLTLYAYNFCWPVRTLAVKDDRGQRQPRSPAMAAGLADHVWSMAEWFSMPAVRHC